VISPKISADRQKVIDKLKGFKKDVMEGSSFATKAVLYSQDPVQVLMGVTTNEQENTFCEGI
jgi:hypothetical protein